MGAATATRTNPAALWAALLALLFALLLSPLLAVLLVIGSGDDGGGPVADIPPAYLALYRAAGAHYGLDWAVLAALGKIETDHGRSTAPGVHSGINFAGCCAGPMQFNVKDGTWAAYGDVGDVYDPADAIPAAARKLRHDGAPADYRRAIYAYNHADWYVDQVLDQAAAYRREADQGATTVPVQGGSWLAPVPGMPGEQCDRRIVPDVVALMARWHVAVTACYAPAGHAPNGEHPLGLATDLVPGRGGSWDDVDALARWVGWTRACGPYGVAPACPLKPWVTFVGYDGYPNHGRGNHLHISWAHGLGQPAETVRVFSRGISPETRSR